MRSEEKIIAVAAATCILSVAIIYAIKIHKDSLPLPFKCNTFTMFNLSYAQNDLIFKTAHDVRLQKNGRGEFIIDGHVISEGKNNLINRVIKLNQGESIDEDTICYQIEGVDVSPTDNTPAELVDRLMAELTSAPFMLELDILKVDEDAYLIGNPIAFTFICMRY